MALCGRLEELMVNVALHIYRNNVIYEKKIPVLYFTLNKAVYGCLRLVLLFCERLVADMIGKGFELNPYNLFVENKMV